MIMLLVLTGIHNLSEKGKGVTMCSMEGEGDIRVFQQIVIKEAQSAKSPNVAIQTLKLSFGFSPRRDPRI